MTIDQDKSELIAGPSCHFGKLDINSFFSNGCQSERAFIIRAEPTGVRCFQTKPLQPNHCCCRLTTRTTVVLSEPHLCVELRIGGNNNEVVNRVKSESHRVESFVF